MMTELRLVLAHFSKSSMSTQKPRVSLMGKLCRLDDSSTGVLVRGSSFRRR
jgi:hypothetical protein